MRRNLKPLSNDVFNKINNGSSAVDLSYSKIDRLHVSEDLRFRTSKIKISRCSLKSFPDGLETFTSVQVLDLSENDITELHENVLQDLQTLQYLDLSCNAVSKVYGQLPQSLIYLDLGYNPNLDLVSLWDIAIPRLEVLKLSYDNINEIPFSIPKWCGTIRHINLDGNHLKSIPINLSYFPVLEEFSVFGNEINTLRLPVHHKQMRLLNFSLNPITEILESANINLQSINLSSTPLKSFPVDILNICGLRMLILSKSCLSGLLDIVLPPTLSILDLSYNEITKVSSRFASSCRFLTVLNLSWNNLTEIPDDFPEQLCFSHIILNHNQLSKIPVNILVCTTVEKLDISNNKFSNIGEFKYPQLREFDISFNNFIDLPDSFTFSAFLIVLNVSYNNLTDLPQSLFNCRKVESLYASHNEFTRIPNCIFSLTSLTTLVFSFNKLTYLPSSFSSFPFLQHIDLSNNNFQSFPSTILLPTLMFLNISHNLIPEIVDFQSHNLTVLDLSYNKIAFLPQINMQKLLCLNISCNQLKSVKLNTPALHVFSCFGNPIEDVEFISPTPKLRVSESFAELSYSNKPHFIRPIFSNHFNFGFSSTLGTRSSMEDSIVIHSSDDLTVLGLFDGHAGFRASKFCANHISEAFRKLQSCTKDNIQDCMLEEVYNIQEKLIDDQIDDGSTAVLSCIMKRTIFSIGIGDSRVTLVKKVGCQRITQDQKPLNFGEFTRLKDSGNGPSFDGRVRKKLSVAQAFGDFWCTGGILGDPVVIRTEISSDDVGLILACDGLWDIIDDESASDIVRNSKSAQDAAISLKNIALSLASRDNVSVIVLLFDNGGFDEENHTEAIPVLSSIYEGDMASLSSAQSRRRR